MSLSEEIAQLAELRDKGILTPEEFAKAKQKVLERQTPSPDQESEKKRWEISDESEDSVGKAANRYVSFRIIMAVIGIIIFLIFFAPMMCSSTGPFGSGP